MAVVARTEQVTPEKAARWLTNMAPNRPLRQSTVLRHAEAMRRGEWRETGEAIKFREDGALIDGQHRLKALIEANVTLPFLVVRGLTEGAVTVLDTGIRRTLSDVLKFRGETNNFLLAATLVSTLEVRAAVQNGRWPSAGTYPTVDWCLQLLEQEPDIRDVVKLGHALGKRKTGLAVYPKTWTTSIYHLSSIDADDCEAFVNQLAKGTELAEDSVIYLFRRRFMATAPLVPRSTRDQFGYLFKTWNYWRNDQVPSQLRLKLGGVNPERFPVPE